MQGSTVGYSRVEFVSFVSVELSVLLLTLTLIILELYISEPLASLPARG